MKMHDKRDWKIMALFETNVLIIQSGLLPISFKFLEVSEQIKSRH